MKKINQHGKTAWWLSGQIENAASLSSAKTRNHRLARELSGIAVAACDRRRLGEADVGPNAAHNLVAAETCVQIGEHEPLHIWFEKSTCIGVMAKPRSVACSFTITW